MVDVADTSALLAWPPVKVSEVFAVPSQLEEVTKFSPERGLLFDSQGPKLVQPSQSSIQAARDASAKTGDLSGLSPIDIEILALSLEMGAILHTDDYRMQNVARSAGIEWKPVSQRGISSGWKWEIRCTGCGKTDNASANENQIKDCDICGSPRKLKKKRK